MIRKIDTYLLRDKWRLAVLLEFLSVLALALCGTGKFPVLSLYRSVCIIYLLFWGYCLLKKSVGLAAYGGGITLFFLCQYVLFFLVGSAGRAENAAWRLESIRHFVATSAAFRLLIFDFLIFYAVRCVYEAARR